MPGDFSEMVVRLEKAPEASQEEAGTKAAFPAGLEGGSRCLLLTHLAFDGTDLGSGPLGSKLHTKWGHLSPQSRTGEQQSNQDGWESPLRHIPLLTELCGAQRVLDQEEVLVWEILTAQPQLSSWADPSNNFQKSLGPESGSARMPTCGDLTMSKCEPHYEW